MIANVRPWWSACPEDQAYTGYLMDRSTILDVLPVSDAAYSLLIQIFSPIPGCRPSLDEIRREVLAMDTFFLTEREASICGWADRFEKRLRRKMDKCTVPSSTSSDKSYKTSSSKSCYSTPTSASRNSNGSSSSAFKSISLASSPLLPVTPPAQAVEIFHGFEKTPSSLELGPRYAVAQTA